MKIENIFLIFVKKNWIVLLGDINLYWAHFVIILIKKLRPNFKIFAYITNYENPGNLFKSKRPDIVIKENDSITAIELTCPFELNIIKSMEYKENKYMELKNDLVVSYKQFMLILLDTFIFRFCLQKYKRNENFTTKILLNILRFAKNFCDIF